MRFLVRHNRHHKVSQSVPHFMSHKTVTTFLRIKVGGHFVMSIVKFYESHYVGVLDNPRRSRSFINWSQHFYNIWIPRAVFSDVIDGALKAHTF